MRQMNLTLLITLLHLTKCELLGDKLRPRNESLRPFCFNKVMKILRLIYNDTERFFWGTILSKLYLFIPIIHSVTDVNNKKSITLVQKILFNEISDSGVSPFSLR